jgi:hypothetical protein
MRCQYGALGQTKQARAKRSIDESDRDRAENASRQTFQPRFDSKRSAKQERGSSHGDNAEAEEEGEVRQDGQQTCILENE